MDLSPCICLLGVIDERVDVAFQRPITARRVRVEPTARVDREVGCFLHRLHGKIAGRLDDDRPLATDPGNNGGPVFVKMAPSWFTLLAPPPRPATQRFLPAVECLTVLPSSVIEFIGFDR